MVFQYRYILLFKKKSSRYQKFHESGGICLYSEKSSLTIFLILAFFLSAIPSAHAAEPLWTYSSPGDEIGGVTISSDGSSVAVAGGKIWLFSKNGTLLTKEPFGDLVIFTPDGSSLVSSYADTIYLFARKTPLKGSESPLQKMWDTSLPGTIRSIDISDDGKIIVASLNQGGTYIFDSTGKMLGGETIYTPIIRISPTGSEIVGVSHGVLCLFSQDAICSESEEGVVGVMPDLMELTDSGSLAVFNDGQRVRSAFLNNKTLQWVTSVSGDITSLAMTPSGSGILVGTEYGNASLLDQYGNISWNYESNPGNKQDAEITCVALSKEGKVAAAGSNDGKIFALNSKGEVIWSNQTKDHIHHITMSADGSLVIATGDNTVYAFSVSKQSTLSVRTTIKPVTAAPLQSVTTQQENISTQKPIIRETTTRDITAAPTEYSVIRTSTQSPLSGFIPLAGLLITLLMAIRRK
jgi:WD40 repeat protein